MGILGGVLALCLCLPVAPSQAEEIQKDTIPTPSTSAPIQTTPQASLSLGKGQRAQIVAIKQAVLSSELAGKIVTLHFREGERFRKGDKLVSYDSALFRARLDRARQSEAAAAQKYKVAKELRALNSISISDFEQARSELSVAKADTRAERVLVNRCVITAPFSGRVGETYIRESEHVPEGAKLLSIYDDSAFEIETILPSRWLAWLTPDYPMTITVDETGETYQAQVTRIAGVIDPVSQSVKVVALLENNAAKHGNAPLMPGMSGTVFVVPPQPAKTSQEKHSR